MPDTPRLLYLEQQQARELFLSMVSQRLSVPLSDSFRMVLISLCPYGYKTSIFCIRGIQYLLILSYGLSKFPHKYTVFLFTLGNDIVNKLQKTALLWHLAPKIKD